MGYKVNQGDENTRLTDAMVYGEEENNSFIVIIEDDNCVKDSSELEVPSPEVIELTSGEESSIVNVVETTTISRTYRCRKCGAPKTRGGHGCPAADQSSSEVTTPSPPGQQLRRVPRKASNSGNLTRLAQRYVEENAEESDPDFPVPIRISPQLNEKRKRSTAVDHSENETTSKRRKVYTCKKCDIPKKECPCKRTNRVNRNNNRQLNGSPVVILERWNDSE